MIANPVPLGFDLVMSKVQNDGYADVTKVEEHTVFAWSDDGEPLILDVATGRLVEAHAFADGKGLRVDGVRANS